MNLRVQRAGALGAGAPGEREIDGAGRAAAHRA
jgi:hypothetical protein